MSDTRQDCFLLFNDLRSKLVKADSLVDSKKAAELILEFYHFDLSEKKSFYFSSVAAKESSEIPRGEKPHMQWSLPVREDFAKDFHYLKDAFKKDLSKKAVPVCFQRSLKNLDEDHHAFLLGRWLARQNSKADIYFRSPDFSYIGFSPEYLYVRRGKYLKTMALAGTRQRGPNYSPAEFLQNPKDREEHQIVVESLKNDLESLGRVKLSETYIQDLSSLSHLRTDFEVELSQEAKDEELVKILHPTPALGVYPRNSLKDWFVKHNRQQDRSFFGAPVLIQTKEFTKCIVGIRSMYQWQSQWQLGAGCGIVADSELDSEWNELKAKRESVLEALDLL